MLEKNFFKLVEEYKDTKNSFMEVEKSEKDLRKSLIMEDENLSEEEKTKMVEKIEAEESIFSEKDRVEMEKEMEDITTSIKLNEIIEEIKEKMEEEEDPDKIENYKEQLNCIDQSIQLIPLFTYNPCIKKNLLNKKYDDYLKTAQKKIGSNKVRLFASTYNIKKGITSIVNSELNSKEIKRLSAFILSYICNANLKDRKQGMFIYHLLRNFSYFDEMSIEQQELFKSSLIGLYSKI